MSEVLLQERFPSFFDNLQTLRNNHSKRTENSARKIQYGDIGMLMDISRRVLVKYATMEHADYLQYGLFFDGETLYFNEPEIEEIPEKELFESYLNQLLHFLMGAHYTLPFNAKPDSGAVKSFKSTTALILSHFGMTGINPIYAQSKRASYYDEHCKGNEKCLILAPHPNLSNYFYNKYFSDNLRPVTSGIVVEVEFANDDSKLVTVYIPRFHFTFYGGINIEQASLQHYRSLKMRFPLIKNKDGKWEKSNFMNKKGKEVKYAGDILKQLSGFSGSEF